MTGFSLALLSVLARGVFGSVERSVLADCVPARSGGRHTILAEAPGTVAEVLAAAAGELLVSPHAGEVTALESGHP